MHKILSSLCWLLIHHALSAQVSPPTWAADAQWISAVNTPQRGVPVFRKVFTTRKGVAKATIYITVHGIYEATLNGRRIGEAYFAPGFTAYDKRLQWQQYDITSALKNNQHHDLRVTVADGWWRSRFADAYGHQPYGSDASILLQLQVVFTDSSRLSIDSDTSWAVAPGQVSGACFYDGECVNNNSAPTQWQPVAAATYTKDNLVPTTAPPVLAQERLRPVALLPGNIVDFGQNMAGIVRLSVKGNKGDTITIAHAEALDSHGHLYTANLRTARATDTFILRGNTVETLSPRFTYHGFRYAQVKGATPTKNNIQAIALYSDLRPTGSFECSNSALNKLHENIRWTCKSNFVDIPTDCPQRSERLGWTMDAAVVAPTAAYLFDIQDFYTKWLHDLMAEQGTNGGMPTTVPDVKGRKNGGIAGWGDAATSIPWALFQHYGDTNLLKRHYPSMRAWVDYIVSVSPGFLWKAGGYGDWYAAGPSTDLSFLNHCYYYRSTAIIVQCAALLQYQQDVEHYSTLLAGIKSAFDSVYRSGIPATQTAYVLGIAFGLLPPERVDSLARLIHRDVEQLATGFMGTPLLLPTLAAHGQTQLAYQLLLNDRIPSWLYMVRRGATTLWEKWDAINGDTIQPASLNHYSFGAVGHFFYAYIAGIRPASPGFRRILIAPEPGGGLSWAKASYRTAHGMISTHWRINKQQFSLTVTIPAGTTATVRLPDGKHHEVNPGSHRFTALLPATPLIQRRA